MKRWALLALLMTGCALFDTPHPTVLEGTVLDYPSNMPIKGALVRWGERTLTVDATGSFHLEDVGAELTLHFWAPGHPMVSRTFRMIEGEKRTVDIPLPAEGQVIPPRPVLFERAGRIWSVDAIGSDEKCLTQDLPGSQDAPSWLLGRSQFAFIQRVPGQTQVWVRLPDGRRARFAADLPDSADELRWHPLGERMVFTAAARTVGRGITTTLRTLDVNTGLHSELISGGTEANPAWSLDGRQIAWARRIAPKPWQIWVAGSRGEHARMLTTRGSCVEPTWSPSGEQVVYASNAQGRWDLYLAGLSTGASEPLTRVPEGGWCHRPLWSPEGDEILFESNYHPGLGHLLETPALFAYRLTTGRVRCVVGQARAASW